MPRILLVDDEPALLGLLRRYLEKQGYQVDACESAAGALATFGAAPLEFAMVVTDLTLKDVTGEELLAQLRQLNPSIPGLIASGYPYQPQLSRVSFLQKPFLPQMLLDAIRTTLSS